MGGEGVAAWMKAKLRVVDRYFGATAFDGSESRPVPFAFVAATLNV